MSNIETDIKTAAGITDSIDKIAKTGIGTVKETAGFFKVTSLVSYGLDRAQALATHVLGGDPDAEIKNRIEHHPGAPDLTRLYDLLKLNIIEITDEKATEILDTFRNHYLKSDLPKRLWSYQTDPNADSAITALESNAIPYDKAKAVILCMETKKGYFCDHLWHRFLAEANLFSITRDFREACIKTKYSDAINERRIKVAFDKALKAEGKVYHRFKDKDAKKEAKEKAESALELKKQTDFFAAQTAELEAKKGVEDHQRNNASSVAKAQSDREKEKALKTQDNQNTSTNPGPSSPAR